MTAWLIPVDLLERCPGACGRLICADPHCHVLRRLADGAFYVEPERGDKVPHPDNPPVLTVDEWRGRNWEAVA